MHDFTQKFQFLIGNLITLAQILTAEHDIEFQFLIGNLITKQNLTVYVYDEKFQFLIGNLITIIFNAIIKCIY